MIWTRGTYRDMRIDLTNLAHPVTSDVSRHI